MERARKRHRISVHRLADEEGLIMIFDIAYSRSLLCALGVKCVTCTLVLELLDAALVQVEQPSLSS